MPKKSSSSVKVFYPAFSREELLAMLRDRLPALQECLPLKRVTLFGSYAKGRQTVASDIDLLIIYTGQPREDAYALVKRTLNIRRLEPHVYTEAEYALSQITIEQMVQDGIPLLGQELKAKSVGNPQNF